MGSVDGSVEGAITVTWAGEAYTAEARNDDIALLLLLNSSNMEVVYSLNAGKRSDETATLNIPSAWSGDPIAAILAFRSADESAVSDSVYLGTETAA